MLVLVALVFVRISVFSKLVSMLLLVLLDVCLTCCEDSLFGQIALKCLFWMKLMKCFHVVSRTRSTTSSSCCHPKFRLECSLLQCLQRLWRSQGSS
uniref:Uncharacterized protein n=1 Tax=Medicago truncatula TaxID=3880 RepID=I3SZI3_MEDTR|nr:unknown [Medicago truncatula]